MNVWKMELSGLAAIKFKQYGIEYGASQRRNRRGL